MNNIQFTRYLYITEEVKLALLAAILNKSDSALFWAYELYYSGFEKELVSLLWQIYFDFFATLNPAFATYFSKKIKEFKTTKDASIFSDIIQTLLYRPFNTDVFFLRTLTKLYQIDVAYLDETDIYDIASFKSNMLVWMANCDYRSLAQWILHEHTSVCIPLEQIYYCCLDLFENDIKLTKSKMGKDFVSLLAVLDPIHSNHILLAKIMELFSKLKQLKSGRSTYFTTEKDAISAYETLLVGNGFKAYQILRTVPLCNIDEFQMLGLFKLKRHKYNISQIYWHEWLPHAATTPLWAERISEFDGTVAGKRVEFPSDDLFEAFHDKYGLEPDEQPKEVQQRSIMPIEKSMTWHTFYKNYRKNGLVEVFDEEFAELDIDDVNY